MSRADYTREELVRLGEAIYERDIRARVEPEHQGEFIVIDVETGDYEIDENVVPATRRITARHPNGARCLLRIGATADVHLPSRSGIRPS